jgi:hypothetical protein
MRPIDDFLCDEGRAMLKKNLIPFIFICILLSFPSISAFAATYYVDGNLSTDCTAGNYSITNRTCTGSDGNAYNSLRDVAGSFLRAGDTVYIRAGTYREATVFTSSGSAGSPITITCYGTDKVIIDGYDTIPTAGSGNGIVHIVGNYVTFGGNESREVEIMRSFEDGVVALGHHCIIGYLYVHHNWESAAHIRSNGGWQDSYGVIQHVRAYFCGYRRYLAGPGTANPAIISACRYPRYVTIKNCTVWSSWGEGISTFESAYTTIQDSISYDNLQNFYLSDSIYSTLKRSLSYCTSGNPIWQREPNQFIYGIMCGNERKYASHHHTVVNNFVMGCSSNFGAGTTEILDNLTVANNTFVNSVRDVNVVFNSGTCNNTVFRNNIILQEDSRGVGSNVSTGLQASYNLWSKSAPLSLSGPGDVTADPKILKAGLSGAGQLTADFFKISADSPARDKAAPMSVVTDDFLGNKRPVGAYPDIGGHEHGGVTPITLNPPANLRVVN